MNEILRNWLIEIAKRKRVATYSDVAAPLGLDMALEGDRSTISDLLCEISTAEHEAGRPLLSAVIVTSESGAPGSLPGEGFFTMSSRLGFDVSDRFMFFVTALNEVHAHWSKSRN